MIPIKHENTGDPACEQCCFCWQVTGFWTNLVWRKPGEQVACCLDCAAANLVKDVPSKKYWCDTARALRKAREAGYNQGRSAQRNGRHNPKPTTIGFCDG